jgi:HK97 family phage major capsid protein
MDPIEQQYVQTQARLDKVSAELKTFVAEEQRQRAGLTAEISALQQHAVKRDNLAGAFAPDAKPTHIGAGLTRDELRAHYQSMASDVAGITDGDAPTLAEFVRGVCGMKTSPQVMAALNTGTDSAGGYALPSVVMPGILEAMAEQSAVMAAGATTLPIKQGAKSVTIAAVNALPQPAWRLELGAVAEGSPTFRGIELKPKSLACVVKISRELLADAPALDGALSTAFGTAVAAELDRVALVGSGVAPEPLGIYYTDNINLVSQAGATFAWADVLAGAQKIAQAKGPRPTSLIVAPSIWTRLAGAQDDNHQWLGPPPMLSSLGIYQTVNVPTDLTSNADESLAFLGDFRTVVIALREFLSIQRLVEKYSDTGEVGLLMHVRADIGVQYPAALSVVEGVK